MNPQLELQLLIISNPELATLQQELDRTMHNMLPYAKCLYLQELLLDNAALLKTEMQKLNRMLNETNSIERRIY